MSVERSTKTDWRRVLRSVQDLYNSSMMLRPKVVQLIRKYDQKKCTFQLFSCYSFSDSRLVGTDRVVRLGECTADLTGMNEKVMQARGIYEQMTGGGQPQPHQQQQQRELSRSFSTIHLKR